MFSYFILKYDLDSDNEEYIEVFNSFSLELCKNFLRDLNEKYPKDLFILVQGFGYCSNGKIFLVDEDLRKDIVK